MIGCAVYCAYKFRPDLQPAAFACSRKMSAPTQQTFTWTWRVWRYVAGSLNWVLFAKKNRKLHDGSPMEMHTKHRDTDATIDDNLWSQADAKVFSDAGWTVPRSMTGVAGKAYGMLVLSKATLQTSVATSSTDAEVQGLCASTKEAVWMRIFVLETLLLTKYEADASGLIKIPIYGDNIRTIWAQRSSRVSIAHRASSRPYRSPTTTAMNPVKTEKCHTTKSAPC
jgi:hypothetical protein